MIDICNGPPIENGLNNVCLHPLSCTFTFNRFVASFFVWLLYFLDVIVFFIAFTMWEYKTLQLLELHKIICNTFSLTNSVSNIA